MLLPIPTINHIPPYDRAEALCNKMDKVFLGINKDIIDLKRLSDPFACPADFLNTFARYLNAYYEDTDSEDTKRHRIWNAIKNSKLFGTWTQVKSYIDDICGGDAKITSNVPDDAWFLCGDGAMIDGLSKPTWAVFGGDEQSAQENTYGIALEGVPVLWEKGMFNIDVDNDHLTQDEVTLLYKALFPSTPVGMVIGVGYVENNQFTTYFTLGETQ